jgi:glycosyltransferase involved in cell wall biosynthesis
MYQILVVGTSRKTRGGITAVIKAHEQGHQWRKYRCKWIETHIDRSNLMKLLYFFRALIQYIILLPFCKLVHIHHAELHREIIFFALAKLLRKKTILHLHACYPETTINGPRKGIFHWAFSNADRVIVLSENWREMVADYLDISANIEVLHNPCPKIESTVIGTKASKQILFAGSICERKGYHDLIAAFSQIAEIHNDWVLVFIGNGEIEKGLDLVEQMGIREKVQFRGWLEGKEKGKAFSEAAIYCLPSYAEGFPMGVLEAWAYGLPVITTPVGGLSDVLLNQENCLLFNPGDKEQLRKQLAAMIENDALRLKIRTGSLTIAKNLFSQDLINEKLERLYESILNA